MMTGYAANEVSLYYEKNIARFLRYGGSGDVAAIHRQIWAAGVGDPLAAFQYLNHTVAHEIAPALEGEKSHVLDLGCGVGGTVTYIASRTGAKVTGVANGAHQLRLAARRARNLGLDGQCRFIRADYLALPEIRPAHAAVAIESFVHAADAGKFFEIAAGQLVPGGRLVVCDDFLASQNTASDPKARKWLGKFKTGWHITFLVTTSEAAALADRVGLKLVRSRDLTEHIKTYPAILLAGMQLLSLLNWRPAAVENWLGGSALQVCIKRGWTRYCCLTFEKGA